MITPTDFDQLYRGDEDPFRVGESWYEQRKIAVTMSSLAAPRYREIWDVGCGTGHLAVALAGRCDRLLAGVGHAEVEVHELPAAPTDSAGRFDLVMLSEVLYYLPPDGIDATGAMVTEITATDRTAEVMVVNWRHFPSDAHLSGLAAADRLDLLLRDLGWQSPVVHHDEDFVLRSWRRPPGTPAADEPADNGSSVQDRR
jgi:hypothetical protein